MNQENLNQEEIKELMKDLEEVGLGSNLIVRIEFSVNPNEFLYTNIPKFVSSYWERNSFDPETRVSYRPKEDDSTGKYEIVISGSWKDVRKIQKEIPSFSWVDSESVSLISEEEY